MNDFDEQSSLFDAAAPVHRSDPHTSKIAATRTTPTMPGRWQAILVALEQHADGLTADELVAATGIAQRHVCQTRAGEMTREHLHKRFTVPLVERTERTRNTSPTGGPACVYVITDDGRRWLEEARRAA